MSRLCDVPVGARVSIDNIAVERRLGKRLAALGLIVGTELEIIQSGRGRVVIRVRGSRVAIGRPVAERLSVTPLTERMAWH